MWGGNIRKKMLWYIAVTPKILDFNMTRYVDGPHRKFLITTKIYAKGIEFFVAMFFIPEFFFINSQFLSVLLPLSSRASVRWFDTQTISLNKKPPSYCTWLKDVGALSSFNVDIFLIHFVNFLLSYAERMCHKLKVS